MKAWFERQVETAVLSKRMQFVRNGAIGMEEETMLWRSSWKIIIPVTLLLAGLAALVVTRNQRNSRAAAEKNPAQILRGKSKLPARENPSTSPPRFPQDDPMYAVMIPPVTQEPGQTELNIPPGIAPIPPEGKNETYPLPAQVTQVHSLAEAGAMGVMPNPSGQVGVPQVLPLPSEARTQVHNLDAQSVTAPLGIAANVIGVPPGVPPDEVGRTRTVPIKK